MTFDEVRQANLTRCREVWHHEMDWSPQDWLMCVTGELGEVAGELKGLRRRGDGIDPDDMRRDAIGDEIADTLLHLDLLAARCGIDLGECIRRKFNRTSEKVGSSVRL